MINKLRPHTLNSLGAYLSDFGLVVGAMRGADAARKMNYTKHTKMELQIIFH